MGRHRSHAINLFGAALAVWLVFDMGGLAASAQPTDQNRYYIQQMIELAASNDEYGINATQQGAHKHKRHHDAAHLSLIHI